MQEALLDELRRADVRATFFVQGRWARAYPKTAHQIASAGHLVGNHSHYHARMSLLSDEGLAVDVRAAEQAIFEVVGVHPRPWFRCPFGDGADDPRVLGALAKLGYRDVNWDVDAADWDNQRKPEQVAAEILSGIREHGDGGIVLLHTWPATTRAILGPLVSDLRQSGAEFVRLDELPTFEQK